MRDNRATRALLLDPCRSLVPSNCGPRDGAPGSDVAAPKRRGGACLRSRHRHALVSATRTELRRDPPMLQTVKLKALKVDSPSSNSARTRRQLGDDPLKRRAIAGAHTSPTPVGFRNDAVAAARHVRAGQASARG